MNFFHFFLMTELFYLPLHFSNGASIAVKLLLANLLVHVITYCVNVTNMYIEYKWCNYKVNIGCFNLVYNCIHPAIFVPFTLYSANDFAFKTRQGKENLVPCVCPPKFNTRVAKDSGNQDMVTIPHNG